MQWNDIIQSRHTTFAWDDFNVPSEELIMDVLKEVYENVPSKNLQFPYQVRLLRNNDPIIRKEIMTICHRNDDRPMETDHGNPQVLAPWLLGFNARWCADNERRYEKNSIRGKLDGLGHGKNRTNDNGGQTQSENLEIGIFATYVTLAMANRGIQTGFCQNICKNYERASEIFKLSEDEKALDFRFIMGIGYGKNTDTRHNYFDPRVDKLKPIPFAPSDVEKFYPRPAFEDIVKGI